MALKDFAATVLTRYKADTSEHKRAIKGLRGEQRKLAKQQLDDAEKQNKKLDEQIAFWGKVTAGIVAAAGAYKAITASVNTFVEVSRLQTNSAGADIEALTKASEGLVGKFDAMRLASKSMTGQFALTQKELENVAAGTAGLIRRGNDVENVLDRVGQAIREGNVEPLKELGITIKGVENDSLEAAQAIAKAMGEMGAGTEQAVDDAIRAQTGLSDATTELKLVFGELAVELVPVVNLMAQLIRDTKTAINDIRDFSEFMLIGKLGEGKGISLVEEGLERQRRAAFARAGAGVFQFAGLDDAVRSFQEQALRDARRLTEAVNEITERRRTGGRGGGRPLPDVASTVSGGAAFGAAGGRDFGGAPLDFGPGGIIGQMDFEAGLDRARAGRGVVADTSPMRSIDDMASAALQGSQAFGMFANSANSAFQAVISGSMSMRDAFKKVLGDMIMGKAFDAFSDALLSTGKALFAFATPGGQASGAAFAASAAKNFAIAATLGGIAKRFGASGSAPGSRGAGNVGPSVRRAREERGDRTFIFGSDFLDESPLERSRRFRRIRGHAEGTTDDGAELL